MTITIREALQLPDMVQTRLVAGSQGLDRQIRWVTIVEVLEDATRLQEGEFLITTGFGLQDDAEKRMQFIPRLAERGLSGVALHTGFYLREIPDVFIAQADECGLPLIEIPSRLNFSTITKAILQPIINRQFETLAYSQAIHEQIIRVALSGKGLPAIASELARLTGGHVAIVDVFGYEVTASGPEENGQKRKSAAQGRVRSVPIQTAKERYGQLSLEKPYDAWQELDHIALQHAATLCALEFVKERAVAETEWRLKGDFAEEILSGSITWSTDWETRSRMLGYPLSGGHLVAAIDVVAETDESETVKRHGKVSTLLNRLAQQRRMAYLLRERASHLLVILPDTKESLSLLEQLASQWSQSIPEHPLRIGVGEPRNHLTDLREAAEEAIFALKAHPLLGKPAAPLFYSQMQGYRILFAYHRQPDSLRQLWQPMLKELLEYDQKHNQQLFKTLTVYLDHNANGIQAAQALFIHRHTLKYRIQLIEAKTGMSLQDSSHRWQLQLAVMAYRLYRTLFADD